MGSEMGPRMGSDKGFATVSYASQVFFSLHEGKTKSIWTSKLNLYEYTVRTYILPTPPSPLPPYPNPKH